MDLKLAFFSFVLLIFCSEKKKQPSQLTLKVMHKTELPLAQSHPVSSYITTWPANADEMLFSLKCFAALIVLL